MRTGGNGESNGARRRWRTGVAAALAAAWAGGGDARADTLLAVTGDDYPPFSDRGLPEGGLATALVREAYARQGDELDVAFDDWADGYDATLAGVYQLTFPYVLTPERQADFFYSEPFFDIELRLFRRAGELDAERPEDLAGRSACLPRGYAVPPLLAEAIDAGAALERPLDMTRCFELLGLGRVDFVLASELQGTRQARATPNLGPGAAEAGSLVVSADRLHVIAPKANPASEGLLARFNAGLAAIEADGAYGRILSRLLDPAEVAAVGLAAGGAAGPSPAASGEGAEGGGVRVAGSEALAEELVPRLVEAFAEAQGADSLFWQPLAGEGGEGGEGGLALEIEGGPPGLAERVEVAAVGTTAGLRELIEGRAEIAMASRPIREGEARAAPGLGDLAAPEAENVVAIDALIPLVHPDNPVGPLSRERLAAVFAGEVADWAELGGEPGPIRPLGLSGEPGGLPSAAREGLGLDPEASVAEARYASNADLADAVAEDPAAVALVGAAEAEIAKAVPLAECGVVQAVDPLAVKTEDYPLARRLLLYAPLTDADPTAAALIEYAVSDEGQALVEELGFASLALRPASPEEQRALAERAASARPQVAGALAPYLDVAERDRRLAVTFRFDTASARLDGRALRDARRLAAWLRGEGIDPAALTLVGFADARGPYEQNSELALRRARAVAAALAAEGAPPGRAISLGEELPVACDTDAFGQGLNRRVEVFLDAAAAGG